MLIVLTVRSLSRARARITALPNFKSAQMSAGLDSFLTLNEASLNSRWLSHIEYFRLYLHLAFVI